MKFAEGENVLAKHPFTSEYYKGRILNIKGDRYKIQFETGTEHTINESDIMYERPGRPTTRTSSRGSRKSPSRQSPSRKSPSRRSPARQQVNTSTRKLPFRSTRLAKVALSRIDDSVKTDNHKEERDKPLDNLVESIPLQKRLKEVNTVIRRSPRLSILKIDQDPVSITPSRNIDRAASLPVERKSYLHKYHLEERERRYSVQKEQTSFLSTLPILSSQTSKKWTVPVAVKKRENEIIKVDQPQEWGGRIGTYLLTFLLPLLIILPQFWCSRGQCKSAHVKFPTDLASYINWHGFLSYTGFLIVLACVSMLPIGKKVDGQQSKIGRLQYRVNGFLNILLIMAVLCACVYKKIPISDYILNNIMQLTVSGWLIGTIAALGLFIKAKKASIADLNIYASTNSKIYNFWAGREINPRIGILDIKLLLVRASLIGTFIINIVVAMKAVGDVKNLEQINVVALLAIFLQLYYILDGLIYEATIFTSFTIMYEGTGYMTCVSHLLYPFLPSLTTRFILYQKPQFNYFVGVFVLSFVIGYMLYTRSNSSKDTFRKNPVSSTVFYTETIPTLRGKKLLVAGLWGYVRHPNYLGDIIMQWSFAGVSLAIDILPYYAALCCTLTLAYRAVRDNKRCKTRYGHAWEQYCSRVKYKILKHIF